VYSPPQPAPPRRRNSGKVTATVAIGFVVGATTIAVTIATSGSPTPDGAAATTSAPANRPVTTLPPGCALLTKAQVAALIPGQVDTSRSSGPVVSNELIQSECEWGNWHDPNSVSLPYVDLHVVATAVATQEVLDNTMHYSLGCAKPTTAAPAVTGADETCVTNSVTDTAGAPINQADVTARRGKLVVEVHFNYDGMPINKVNTTATETAATVITAIMSKQ
jgi:hypothetical protein